MSLTFLAAAEKILKEAGEPLHYRDIARCAVEKKLITTQGKTPEATMGAQLYLTVKKASERGDSCPFAAAGNGYFTLASGKLNDDLTQDIQKQNKEVKDELLEYLLKMHPRQMELLVGQLFTAIGFTDVIVTDYSGDGGIDVQAILTVGGVTKVSTAIQVKRWQKNVTGKTVRELRGGLKAHQRGLIVTTSGFTKDAQSESEEDGKAPISLIDGQKFVELMVEHQVGIVKQTIPPLLKLNLEELIIEEGEDDKGRKSAVLWPLPGGQENFFDTLINFLNYIGNHSPNIESMTEWVMENFERVTKHDLVKNYLRAVLYPMGLIIFNKDKITLTKQGESLRGTADPEELLMLLKKNIVGVEELIQFVKEKGEANSGQIKEHLCDELNLKWETDAQVNYRLQWLVAVGLLEKTSGKWSISKANLS